LDILFLIDANFERVYGYHRAFEYFKCMTILSAHRRFSQQKCCKMHESPVRRAAPQHPEVDANDSKGPFKILRVA
jgi:hypothetical protein